MRPTQTSRGSIVAVLRLRWRAGRHPYNAACWSTAKPVTGSSPPKTFVVPMFVVQLTISGNVAGSTPNNAHASADHWRVSRSISAVRDAVLTSVTYAPVRRWISHESVVVTTPAVVTFSRSHNTFGPTK
jgi:hypothetical protein